MTWGKGNSFWRDCTVSYFAKDILLLESGFFPRKLAHFRGVWQTRMKGTIACWSEIMRLNVLCFYSLINQSLGPKTQAFPQSGHEKLKTTKAWTEHQKKDSFGWMKIPVWNDSRGQEKRPKSPKGPTERISSQIEKMWEQSWWVLLYPCRMRLGSASRQILFSSHMLHEANVICWTPSVNCPEYSLVLCIWRKADDSPAPSLGIPVIFCGNNYSNCTRGFLPGNPEA